MTPRILAAWAYVVKFYALASTKLTTYVALLTAGLSELLGSWDQAAGMFPAWLLKEKSHIVAASALLAVWTRIRKQL